MSNVVSRGGGAVALLIKARVVCQRRARGAVTVGETPSEFGASPATNLPPHRRGQGHLAAEETAAASSVSVGLHRVTQVALGGAGARTEKDDSTADRYKTVTVLKTPVRA